MNYFENPIPDQGRKTEKPTPAIEVVSGDWRIKKEALLETLNASSGKWEDVEAAYIEYGDFLRKSVEEAVKAANLNGVAYNSTFENIVVNFKLANVLLESEHELLKIKGFEAICEVFIPEGKEYDELAEHKSYFIEDFGYLKQ